MKRFLNTGTLIKLLAGWLALSTGAVVTFGLLAAHPTRARCC